MIMHLEVYNCDFHSRPTLNSYFTFFATIFLWLGFLVQTLWCFSILSDANLRPQYSHYTKFYGESSYSGGKSLLCYDYDIGYSSNYYFCYYYCYLI